MDLQDANASSETRRCDWCGASAPADQEHCASCGAAFPRPEQDEALRRASEARIRAALDEIELRRRGRRGLGRLLG
jgi:hypothetical protein